MLQMLKKSAALPPLDTAEIRVAEIWGSHAARVCIIVLCDAGTALCTPPCASRATQHTSPPWVAGLVLGGCKRREFARLTSTRMGAWLALEAAAHISVSWDQFLSSARAKMKSGFKTLSSSAKSLPRRLKAQPSLRIPNMAPIFSMESR